jgi:exopolyphosphatase/guanosine-5'-triphosphate,3'-diphosphate pyrophosphatase
MLHLGLTEWHREKVHGLVLTLETLRLWKTRLIAVTAVDRTKRYGVRPIRADVFPAGLSIQEAVLAHFGKDTFTVSVNGLRVGAALSLLD